jgi:hypothetical protein
MNVREIKHVVPRENTAVSALCPLGYFIKSASTAGRESIVGWLFASVNTLNDILSTELIKELWKNKCQSLSLKSFSQYEQAKKRTTNQ